MRYVGKRRLDATFPGEYDRRYPWHFRMPANTSWKRMTGACALLAGVANARSVIAFPAGRSGWKDLPRRYRRGGVEFESADDAVALVSEHSYFRSNVFEDYYLSDWSFSWIVKFCHEGDWHAFLPERIACSKELKEGYSQFRFVSMPPWPPAFFDEE